MKREHSVRGWLVGGIVVLAMVVASLVLGNMVSVATPPEDSWVQPVPVPTPPPVHAAAADAAASAPAFVPSQPEPAPVPAPPDSPVSPQGQASRATVLLLLGLSAFATFGLFILRLGAGLPSQSMESCVSVHNIGWLFCTEFRQAQAQLGLTPTLYEGYFLVLRVVAALPLLGLSLLLVWRRSDELRVLLLAALRLTAIFCYGILGAE